MATEPSEPVAPVASDEPTDEDDKPRELRAPRAIVPSRPPRPRRRRLVVMVLAPLVIAAGAATLLPTFLLSRAEERVDACLREIIQSGEGDPQACLPHAYETRLAERLPWLEREARQLGVDARYRAAVVAYGKATAIAPDAGARREAAHALFEASQPMVDATTSLAALEGAFEEVTEIARASDDATIRAYAFKSARAIGDLDGLRELSQKNDPEAAHVLMLWRGGVLCLSGDADAGRRIFLDADRSYRERAEANVPAGAKAKLPGLELAPQGYGGARLALNACGGKDDEAKRVPLAFFPARAALEASRMSIEGLDGARVLLDSSERQLLGEERLRLAAFAIADPKSERPDAVATLALLAPRHGPAAALDIDAVRTPSLVSGSSDPQPLVLIEPAVAETAAAHLESLAADNAGKELTCAGDECPVEIALGMPDRLLREGARMLWFEAATEHARRMQRAPALADLAKAAALTPERRRHEAASVHLAVDDAQGALDAIAPSLGERLPHSTRSLALVNQTLAFAHLGRFDKAYAASELAFTAAMSHDRSSDDEDVPEAFAEQTRVVAGWIWGAMALRADKGGEVIGLLKDASSDRLAALAQWLELAKLPEAERRAKRWNLSMREPIDAALTAAMYVVGRVAPPNGNVEVWLDRVFFEQHRNQPLRSMLARAEAARWRGDADAEKTWRARAQRLAKLSHDYPSALLAQLVELR